MPDPRKSQPEQPPEDSLATPAKDKSDGGSINSPDQVQHEEDLRAMGLDPRRANRFVDFDDDWKRTFSKE